MSPLLATAYGFHRGWGRSLCARYNWPYLEPL
jgi:hypothetical protein